MLIRPNNFKIVRHLASIFCSSSIDMSHMYSNFRFIELLDSVQSDICSICFQEEENPSDT
jgi:hypothetical protein